MPSKYIIYNVYNDYSTNLSTFGQAGQIFPLSNSWQRKLRWCSWLFINLQIESIIYFQQNKSNIIAIPIFLKGINQRVINISPLTMEFVIQFCKKRSFHIP